MSIGNSEAFSERMSPYAPVLRNKGALVTAATVVALVALAWFMPLGLRHLLPSDEGRYAEIAREMYASGDWVTIRYNGLKYFEKPPFQLWMTAIAYSAFGVGEWQARLWVAVTGALGLFATVLAARRWHGPRVAGLAGLILLAAPAWNIASHFNSLDMGVSGALACVLAAFLIAQHPDATEKQQRNWMWAAWAAMAVAVLTKGLIGIVLPGLVLVVYSMVGRDWQIWRRLHVAAGLLIVCAIAEPWFVLISKRNPEFLSFFFIHEHFDRYLSTVHRRDAPWWYFAPQLLVGFLPWLGLTMGMGRIVRDDIPLPGFKPHLFLATWALVIFGFFSLSSSKLPGYIIPVYPALAILAAVALARLDSAQWRRHLLIALCLIVLGSMALPLLARQGHDDVSHRAFGLYAGWLAGLLGLAFAGCIGAWWSSRGSAQTRVQRSVVIYAITAFGLVTGALVAHEVFGRESSGIALVAPIKKVLTADMPIYSVRVLDHTLPFYLGSDTIMVEEPDELDFGTRREPQKWLPTLDDFIRVWTTGPRAVALMSPATHEELLRRHVPMFELTANTRRTVITNFATAAP